MGFAKETSSGFVFRNKLSLQLNDIGASDSSRILPSFPLATVQKGEAEAISLPTLISPAPPRVRWPFQCLRWRGAAGSMAGVYTLSLAS
jgi:hypothetical protein